MNPDQAADEGSRNLKVQQGQPDPNGCPMCGGRGRRASGRLCVLCDGSGTRDGSPGPLGQPREGVQG